MTHRWLKVRVSDALADELDSRDFTAAGGLSAFVRQAVADAMGDPELAVMRPAHRPKKDDADPKPAAAKRPRGRPRK